MSAGGRDVAEAKEPVRFVVDGFRVTLAAGLDLVRREEQIRRLLDPGSATRTLHWGRNYLYATEIETSSGSESVVVKQFRHTTLKARLRRRQRGSKAERSFRAAHQLLERGLLTPEPLVLVDSLDVAGPSLYVSREIEGGLEARYLMRAMNAGRAAELFPDFDPAAFVDELARLARRLHDAHVWYRDFTSGNVLLDLRRREGSRVPPLLLVDLNRARVGRRLSRSERMRDLARQPLLRSADQERLLSSYARAAAGDPTSRLLYRVYHRSFLLKNRSKRSVRSGLRRAADALLPRRGAHAHVASPAPGAGPRDKVVWDPLSDQPHQHAGRLEKLRVRLVDAPAHVRGLAAAARVVPAAWRGARERGARFASTELPRSGVGVALRPLEGRNEELVRAVADLGVGTALLRLHPWAGPRERRAETELAAELHRRGLDLVFALPQSREMVRDPERWSAAVAAIAESFLPFGRTFQVGQAPNRSKWGIWTPREYAELFGRAAEILRRRGDVLLLGPAVIDFEPHATALYLNLPDSRLDFDVVSSLLYVDRRGAPENRQLGLDLLGKLALIKTLAETTRNSRSGRSWVTEVNWPLHEGPHSPAGRDVAVSEEEQASYLARYYLLALASGLAERVYWWQLAARGYGLCDPAAVGLRRRPAFFALAQARSLEGAVLESRLASPPDTVLLELSRPGGSRLAVGWSTNGGRREAELPRAPSRTWSRDGEEKEATGRRVELGPAPTYFELPPA